MAFSGFITRFETLNSVQYKNLLELIAGGLAAKNEAAMTSLFDFAQSIIQFESAIAARVKVTQQGIHVQNGINHSFDAMWINTYIDEKFEKIDPVVRYSLDCQNPFSWTDAYSQVQCPNSFFDAARDFGLQSGYSFALESYDKNSTCEIISFSNVDDRLVGDGVFLLRILVPVFREVIAKVADKNPEESGPQLTVKEHEVLRWAMEGKSIWDIAQILSITERTVKFHLQNVYKKLNVMNRAQAVATAMKLGLI